MSIFSRNKKSDVAEREALELQAAMLVRLAQVTRAPIQYDEDETGFSAEAETGVLLAIRPAEGSVGPHLVVPHAGEPLVDEGLEPASIRELGLIREPEPIRHFDLAPAFDLAAVADAPHFTRMPAVEAAPLPDEPHLYQPFGFADGEDAWPVNNETSFPSIIPYPPARSDSARSDAIRPEPVRSEVTRLERIVPDPGRPNLVPAPPVEMPEADALLSVRELAQYAATITLHGGVTRIEAVPESTQPAVIAPVLVAPVLVAPVLIAPVLIAPVLIAPVLIADVTEAEPLASSVTVRPMVEALMETPVHSAPRSAISIPGLSPDALTDEALLQATAKHLRSIGAVNILVAGQTGVGKSTLINSVFGEAFAKTASGEPVTQHAEWYSSGTVPLRILDTRGLEAKDYAFTLSAMRSEIENSRAQKDERHQLHMGWVCISSPSSRVQDCEVDIVRLLNKYDIPAIIVLTKDDDDDDFEAVVSKIMIARQAHFTAIVRVRALAKTSRPAIGLTNLVTATFTALPAAHRSAFAAAQKINRELNRSTANDYVTAAASAAAAASVIPIPFADVATLAPIQAGMLVGISNAFGLPMEKAQIMQLITTVLGCLALTLAGGWAFGNVLKFIPGPGSVLGAVVNASVAGAVTRSLGKAYIRFLVSFSEVNGRLPTADEIFDIFPTFFKAGRAV